MVERTTVVDFVMRGDSPDEWKMVEYPQRYLTAQAGFECSKRLNALFDQFMQVSGRNRAAKGSDRKPAGTPESL